MRTEDLNELVRAHQASVYRYVRYLGADWSTAEDVVQETYLAAYNSQNPPDLRDVSRRSAWLLGIARNKFLSLCRQTRRTEYTDDFVEKADAFWFQNYFRFNEGFDCVDALRQCLRQLPSRQSEVLYMRYTRRLSRSEMARMLELSEEGVKKLLRRIRLALADCVESRIREESVHG